MNGKQIFELYDVGNLTPVGTTAIDASGFDVNGSAETWANTHTTVTRSKALSSLSNPQVLAVQKAVLVVNNSTTPTASIGIEADNSGGIGTYFGMNLFNDNDTDFGITSTRPYEGSVIFNQEGAGSTTTQTAIKQGTITVSDTALQPFTQITTTQIKIDDNFATTTPNTATLTSGNLEIKGVNVISGDVSTTDIFPASIQLEQTGQPTTIFTTTSLTSGSSTATWADIISGAAGDNTLQEVLTAGNTATNLNITLTNGGSGSGLSSMTLSPVSTNIGAIENFVANPAYSTAQTTSNVGASSGYFESSMFINDASIPVQYQTIGKLYQEGDKINDTLNVRPTLQCFELLTDSMGTITKEAKYNSTGITATNNAGLPYEITTAQSFGVNAPNLSISSGQINFPPSANERSQIEARGFTCQNAGGSGYSWWRNTTAYMSNLADTVYTYITNTTIQITSTTTAQNFIASSANLQITNGLSATYANLVGLGQALIATINEGYLANPMLELANKSTTAGATNGVPTTHYYKQGRNVVQNDYIASEHFFAKNYLGNKTEFGRITYQATNSSAGGGDDGACGVWCAVNGTIQQVFLFNGADNQNNSFRPLDMNGNNVIASTGSMSIDTSASATAGATLTLATKDNVAGSGAGLVLSGNTLLSATSSGNSGQHLALTIGGTVYKIQLLNN